MSGLLLAKAGGFHPLQIANCQLWLDAAQITGLVDADPVTTWNDLSGNARNASQATSANKPTYRTSQINGLPVVRFDGTDDFMTAGSAANWVFLHDAGGHTIYIVFEVAGDGAPTDPNALYSILDTCDILQANVGYALFYDDRVSIPRNNRLFTLAYRGTGGTFTYLLDSGDGYVSPQTAYTFSDRYENAISGNDATGQKNADAEIGVETSSAPSSSNPTYTLQIGRRGGGTGFGDVDIAELLLYDGRHSDAQRAQIRTYLRGKWAT